MKHKAVLSGYPITGEDDGRLLEAPGGAALSGPPSSGPASVLPGFDLYLAVGAGDSARVTLDAGQELLGGGSVITVPAGEMRHLVRVAAGKWAVR